MRKVKSNLKAAGRFGATILVTGLLLIWFLPIILLAAGIVVVITVLLVVITLGKGKEAKIAPAPVVGQQGL